MTVIYVKVQLSVMVWRSRGTREGRINSNESVLLGLEKKKNLQLPRKAGKPPAWLVICRSWASVVADS